MRDNFSGHKQKRKEKKRNNKKQRIWKETYYGLEHFKQARLIGTHTLQTGKPAMRALLLGHLDWSS